MRLFTVADVIRALLFAVILLLVPLPLARHVPTVLFISCGSIISFLLYRYLNRISLFQFLTYLLVAIGFCALHARYNVEYAAATLQQSVEGTATGPWRDRVLMPYFLRAAGDLLGTPGYELHYALRVTVLLLCFCSTHYLLRRFSKLSADAAFLLPLLYTFMIPFSWDFLYVTDFPSILFSVLALTALFADSTIGFLLAFFFGVLNRESGVTAAFMYLCYHATPESFSWRGIPGHHRDSISRYLFVAALAVLTLGTFATLAHLLGGSVSKFNSWSNNYRFLVSYGHFVADSFALQSAPTTILPVVRVLSISGGLFFLLLLFIDRIDTKISATLVGSVILTIPFALHYSNLQETRCFYHLFPLELFAFAQVLPNAGENLSQRADARRSTRLGAILHVVLITAVITICWVALWETAQSKIPTVPDDYFFDFESASTQGFSAVTSSPDAVAEVSTQSVHQGSYALKMAAAQPAQALFIAKIPVRPDSCYQFSAFFRTERLLAAGTETIPGHFFVGHLAQDTETFNPTDWEKLVPNRSEIGSLQGDTDWHPLSIQLRTNSATKAVLIGIGLVRDTTGAIFADDISVQRVNCDPNAIPLTTNSPSS